MWKNDNEQWKKPYIVVKNHENGRGSCMSLSVIPIEVAVLNNLSSGSKCKVSGICLKCGNPFVRHWFSICDSKVVPKQAYCGKCANTLYRQTEESRKSNSEAQLKIQGTPEAREKMSKILKEKHQNDPSLAVRISEGLLKMYSEHPEVKEELSKKSKEFWTREGYQEKVTGFGYYSGTYKGRCGDVFFASSWELKFLIWCNENKDVSYFSRCCDKIPYEHDGSHSMYYPDFEVIIKDKKYVFEIKGGKSHHEVIEKKRVASINFYKGEKEYSILYKQDLKRLGIVISDSKVSKELKGLEEAGIISLTTYGQKNKKDYFDKKVNRIKEKEEIARLKKESVLVKNRRSDVLADWDYDANNSGFDHLTVYSLDVCFFKCHICGTCWNQSMENRCHSKISCPCCVSRKISEVTGKRMRERGEKIRNERDDDKISMKMIEDVKSYYYSNNKLPTMKKVFDKNKNSIYHMTRIFKCYGHLLEKAKQEISDEENQKRNVQQVQGEGL